MCTLSKRSSSTSPTVRWNCASVSPQKPTITSVVRDAPGRRSRVPPPRGGGPLEAIHLVDRLEQVGEVGLVGQVVAVGVDDLAQQRYLAHAPRNQRLDLAHDLGDGAAALAATPVGDDAEGAELVAAED